MRPFEYSRAHSLADASKLTHDDNALAIAGGTNLLDLMKLQVETPEKLADINFIGLAEINDNQDGGSRMARVTNTATAVDPRVRADYPVLARAILAGATQQLRNKATTGGNLCQRARCLFHQHRSAVQ